MSEELTNRGNPHDGDDPPAPVEESSRSSLSPNLAAETPSPRIAGPRAAACRRTAKNSDSSGSPHTGHRRRSPALRSAPTGRRLLLNPTSPAVKSALGSISLLPREESGEEMGNERRGGAKLPESGGCGELMGNGAN